MKLSGVVMSSISNRIDHAKYKSNLFSTDKELFGETAAKVSSTVKIEGNLPQTNLKERSGDWVHLPTVKDKAQTLAGNILKKTRDNQDGRAAYEGRAACKRGIASSVQANDLKLEPKEKKEFRQTINSEISKDLVIKGLKTNNLTLKEGRELLKFVDESKEEIDNTTFHELRGQVISKLCDLIPKSSIGRKSSVEALYSAQKGFHLGNLHTIKDSEIRKMFEEIDKGIGETLEGYFEYGLTPDFIDEYLSAMADAVKFVNTVGAYIGQASQERKQILRSANKVLQGILSPGKKRGLFGGVNPNFETAKVQVVFQDKQLNLMMKLSLLKRAHPKNVNGYKSLERELKSAKDINQLEDIEERLKNINQSFDSRLDIFDLSYELEEFKSPLFQERQSELREKIKNLNLSDLKDKENWDLFLEEVLNAKKQKELDEIALRLDDRIDDFSN